MRAAAIIIHFVPFSMELLQDITIESIKIPANNKLRFLVTEH